MTFAAPEGEPTPSVRKKSRTVDSWLETRDMEGDGPLLALTRSVEFGRDLKVDCRPLTPRLPADAGRDLADGCLLLGLPRPPPANGCRNCEDAGLLAALLRTAGGAVNLKRAVRLAILLYSGPMLLDKDLTGGPMLPAPT
eukprot:CAMPEP_0115359762 /NCGR_PEP_ID=MMETSP0270-20121206/101337_1 /TAXON_ID=71861 /ORGANISM="Scrippsiella trochoidea, Strain CCMP3099" /LENGTH=139 /DNA_ID=CAMNT_0002782273 /DNA_START=348 /DNA_END=767 /DNA_ORIENTATION=-